MKIIITIIIIIIIIITRTASSYEWGPSPPCTAETTEVGPKDDELGGKVRTQANVWAVVFAGMGSALEAQKAECVPIWICCNKPRPH